MNLDEVMEGWRAQDASTFFGVDKTRLHQTLRQEHAKLEKQSRMGTWGGYVFGVAPLLISSGLFLAIMFQSNYDDVLIVWDYVVGVAGVAGAIMVAWALFALRRSQRAREQRFGDSLRDHLRRRVAQLDAEATVERRLALITLAGGVICVFAIPIAQNRIADVPVPYSEMTWPPALPTILIVVLLCLELFRWAPRRWRRKNLARRHQLEALLKELDGQ
jgi:hypothetical protein